MHHICYLSGAACHRQSRRIQPRALSKPMDYCDLQPYVALVCHLIVFTPVIHALTLIIIDLLTQKKWKAELA